MNELDVLELVLQQIGEISIPFKDDDTRHRLEVISRNLRTLLEVYKKEQLKVAEPTSTAKVAGCACTSAEEAREDVQSIRDAN